jgi:rhodanese-related sulfurtransferase
LKTVQNTWKERNANGLREILTKENIQFIDVREKDEFSSGHIPGVKNIPLSEISERTNEIDPDKEVVCICRSGNRSEKACEYLSSLGYKNLTNFKGGMLEWDGDIE